MYAISPGDGAGLSPLEPRQAEEYLAHIDRGSQHIGRGWQHIGRCVALADICTGLDSARLPPVVRGPAAAWSPRPCGC